MNSKKKCPHITSNDLRVIQAIHKITEVEKKIVKIHDEHKETAVG